MTKADKRAAKRHRERYGHAGSGSVHTRQASALEVLRHVQKAQGKRRAGRK